MNESFMREAFAEARVRFGRTGPGPAVGAVIVTGDRIVGRGHYLGAGAHAEVRAIESTQGADLSRATMYVSLEPHGYHGRTPPCTAAIIAAGIREVVFGCIDPNPKVAGDGIAQLKAAGVKVVGPVLEAEAREIISDFELGLRLKRPWIVVKAGMTLDAKVVTRTGEAKWITSEASRARGRQLRGEVQGVIAGIGTVLADDPALTVRDGRSEEPAKIIFDSKLRTPPKAAVLDGRCIIVTSEKAPRAREKRLNAEIVRVKGGVLPALRALYKRCGFTRLLLEGGPTLTGAFLDAGAIDELHLFMAPMLFGGEAPSFAMGEGPAKIGKAMKFGPPTVEPIGSDLHLRYLREQT